MKELNIDISKEIVANISKKIIPDDHREYFLLHSEKVGKVAKIIGKKLDLNIELLEIAGWLHDIGYSESIENHSEYSLKILNYLNFNVNSILKDCILNHGSNKKTTTTEGKIFQLADKLCIFDLDIIELMLKYGDFPFKKNDISFLKEGAEKSFKLLEKFI